MKTVLWILLIFIGIGSSGVVNAQNDMGKLVGRVTEEGDPLPMGTIRVMQDGVVKTGSYSDEEGKYSISRIPPGSYTIKLSFGGREQIIESVNIYPAKTTHLDMELPYWHPDPYPWYQPVGWDDFKLLESSGYQFNRSHIQEIQR